MAAADRTKERPAAAMLLYSSRFLCAALLGRTNEQCEQQCREYNTDRVRHCGIVNYRAVRCLAVQQAAEAFRRKDEVRAGNRAHEGRRNRSCSCTALR